MTMHVDIKALAAAAAAVEDQTVTKDSTEYEYTPPPAGKTVARFVSYVELGKQPQRPYQGKAKPPAEEVRIVFELLHPKKNIRTIVVDGKEVQVSDYIAITTAKKLGDKAKFKKLFDQMRYGRETIKHMAQMLGDDFIVTVFHNSSEKDGKTTLYANLNDASGAYHIGSPYITDPMTEETKRVPVPESLRGLQIFLFDNPTKETWDSLFIDGEREIKNGDQVTVRSNNWLQERIMSSVNFDGSALHGMLEGLNELPVAEPEAPPVEQPAKSPTLPAGGVQASPGTQPTPKAPSAADAALEALGLG